MAGGYLLLGRQDNTGGLPGASRPTVAMPVEEIHVRYRGLEGEPWPNRPAKLEAHLVSGLLPGKALQPARKYYEIVAQEFLCDLIYIETFTHSGGESELPRDFTLLGFDFGHFYATDDYVAATSHIYRNVLFGEIEELREEAGGLNEHLLFGDHRDLKNFSRTLTRLLATKDSAMEESSLGQGFSIYGLPMAQRVITRQYASMAGFLE